MRAQFDAYWRSQGGEAEWARCRRCTRHCKWGIIPCVLNRDASAMPPQCHRNANAMPPQRRLDSSSEPTADLPKRGVISRKRNSGWHSEPSIVWTYRSFFATRFISIMYVCIHTILVKQVKIVAQNFETHIYFVPPPITYIEVTSSGSTNVWLQLLK